MSGGRDEELRSLGLDPAEVDRQLAWSSKVAPIVEAILMGDRGQPCSCTERGPCYMHAQQERATAALDSVRGDLFALAKASRLLLSVWDESADELGSDWVAIGDLMFGLRYALAALEYVEMNA